VQHSMDIRINPNKLSQCYYSPYQVFKRIGTVTFKLQLSETMSNSCIQTIASDESSSFGHDLFLV